VASANRSRYNGCVLPASTLRAPGDVCFAVADEVHHGIGGGIELVLIGVCLLGHPEARGDLCLQLTNVEAMRRGALIAPRLGLDKAVALGCLILGETALFIFVAAAVGAGIIASGLGHVGRRRTARLDEAEAAARHLLVRFPDVHDGWDRLGMVHEARGDSRQAADCYRKVIDFIRQHPDDYDAGMLEQFAKLVDRLDPPVAT